MIDALSPLDGRYSSKTQSLRSYFSEMALIKYRIKVEVDYFLFLDKINILDLSKDSKDALGSMLGQFNKDHADRVKAIEKTTNHDVKAVEYFIKEQLGSKLNAKEKEHIHFALTSQDINNTALPLMIKDALHHEIIPTLKDVNGRIEQMAQDLIASPLLTRTHGQAASPSTMGKEIYVFFSRLEQQIEKLAAHKFEAKFGGATGNFNAHKVAYPELDWPVLANEFISGLGLRRQQHTTQIAHYDNLAEVFQILNRICTILIDFSRDIWTYVSMDYFKQKTIKNEVGSSAMPHKVNPIDFENAEGNLGMAISILEFLTRKLPISRLQRDLTDSTVSRNVGVPFGHILISLASLNKGIQKLELNHIKLSSDLTESWAVVSEGIQTILRREGWEKPYELLKSFSRGKGKLTQTDFTEFINSLETSVELKKELLDITPHNYIGYADQIFTT